ncbi:hypothetical protein PVAP13_1NG321600 [Panicum virgatum]|uniref:HVA22-like protein n=1 Tax=Panicum virgatum TaxID=38727 RepID=A0A8T0X425_PANVG|nr:hypothetical protein PVAP13_1NG321600 [Panicum virgatum]
MFVNRQIVNIWYVPRNEKSSKPDDVLSAAERYIEQNGPEAFEKLISKIAIIRKTSTAATMMYENQKARCYSEGTTARKWLRKRDFAILFF